MMQIAQLLVTRTATSIGKLVAVYAAGMLFTMVDFSLTKLKFLPINTLSPPTSILSSGLLCSGWIYVLWAWE